MILVATLTVNVVLGLGFILFEEHRHTFTMGLNITCLMYVCTNEIMDAIKNLEAKLQNIKETP